MMRRKIPSNGSNNNGGGYNNQRPKPRYQQGASGGDHRSQGGHNSNGRVRKNYPALREKYLTQARDALASGDRVLAENYFQHADHCYRMMMEEGQQRQQYNQQNPQASDQQSESATGDEQTEHFPQENAAQLPAFLTASYEPEPAKPVEPVIVPNWEE
jgi:hypothetical protein